MRMRWRLTWGGWLVGAVLAALAGAGGCLNFAHPVVPDKDAGLLDCKSIPEYCRNRVYIFLIQGNDPNELSNFEGVCDHFHSLGFIKTYYGYLWHVGYFADEMRRIHEWEPDARFIVCGFSVGGRAAWRLAREVEPSGITLDLVLFLDAVTLSESAPRPNNADRVVHIYSNSWFLQADPIEGIENYQVDVKHHGVPTHPRTLELFQQELVASALRVPIVQKVVPPPFSASPTPRPLAPPPAQTLDKVYPAPPVRKLLPAPQQAQQGKKALPPPAQARQQGKAGQPAQAGKSDEQRERERREDWDFLKAEGIEGIKGTSPAHVAPLTEPSNLQFSSIPASSGKDQKGGK